MGSQNPDICISSVNKPQSLFDNIVGVDVSEALLYHDDLSGGESFVSLQSTVWPLDAIEKLNTVDWSFSLLHLLIEFFYPQESCLSCKACQQVYNFVKQFLNAN